MKTQTALIKYRSKLSETASYLLIAFGFILPISVAMANILALLITAIWLLRGGHQENWRQVRRNPVVLAILGFVALHVTGLLWTTDLHNGLYVLKKESILLFIPVFMLCAKKEHIKYYSISFLVAITLTVAISYGIWFEVIPPTESASVANPTPFMSHISYNPFLTVAIYLLLYAILFDESANKKQKFLYISLAVLFTVNMFITQGRAGQVMYFFMLAILLFQYFHKNLIKAVIATAVTIPIILLFAYNTSDVFSSRVKAAIKDIKKYDNDKRSDVGLRLAFAINSFEIIKNNPIVGVGTGDFNVEYERVNARKTPELPATTNPHNMYVLELVQFGILGLFSLLSILGAQFYQARKSEIHLIKSMGVALPLLFAVIMLSDSYLRGHFTTMLFVFFSSFLYKDYEE